jgi:polyferredoxin/Tfp pilus assembly protein PilF
VLIALHLLIAVHATHFYVAGRSLSPVEPSESMYTLELGQVNAGFVFFAAALVATLVFGRFICGWGCHLVALQDLCAWLMKKAGIRPRPFRSRLLLWIPTLLAFYMFVWPSLHRLLDPSAEPFPGFSNHLMTSDFWATFTGPLFATMTFLTCGFAAVYLLGAKGFCSYGCPYGALFAFADRFSAGRIVVNDACEQCGHCSATCTSNVRVHEEVRLYGMVVDPGCMKCTDCVSVCPTNALSFKFAKPSILRGRPENPPRERVYSLPFGEELAVLTVGIAATLAFRALYDGPPLLMAVGLGAITAFIALKLWHLLRRPTVRVQNLNLKLGGAMRPSGWLFAGLAVGWLAFATHSGFVQWHRLWGRHHLERTEASRLDVLSGRFARNDYSDRHHEAVAKSVRHFKLAEGWGLRDVAEVKLGLAWGHLLDGDDATGESEIREAIDLAPYNPQLHQNLIDFLLARGRFPEAIDATRHKIELVQPEPGDHFLLAGLLAQTSQPEAAVAAYRACAELVPESAEVRYNLGGLLRRLERPDEAIEQLRLAGELAPTDPDTHVELGLAYMASGDNERAIAALRRAIELDPDSPESRFHLPALIEQLKRPDSGD